MRTSLAVALIWIVLTAKSATEQFSCDTSRLTKAKIKDCANAVRMNPGRFQFPCVSNAERSTHPLRPNAQLATAAQRHAADMAARRYFSHTLGSVEIRIAGDCWVGRWMDREFDDRIRAAGYQGSTIGENLAKGYRSAFGAVRGWICSPGHRRNLMSCAYNEIGTGVDCRFGSCHVVQLYGCSGGDCCSSRALPSASQGESQQTALRGASDRNWQRRRQSRG